MSEPTPIYEETDENDVLETNIYYVDVEPTPGRSPRLDLPIPAGVTYYSSKHGPFGAIRPRLARGDVTVFDELAAADVTNEYEIASLVERGITDAIGENRAVGAPLLAALEKAPEKVRARIVSSIVSYLRYASPDILEVYAGSRVFAGAMDELRIARENAAKEPPYAPSFDLYDEEYAEQLARDVNLAVRSVENGAVTFLAMNPDAKTDVIIALECAIRDQTEPAYVRLAAVAQLAQIDGAYLTKLAATPAFDDPALASIAGPVHNFPEPGQLARRMVELGLVPADEAELAGDARTVEQVFGACGQMMDFNCETDVYPNGHERVLKYLSVLVSPLLDDVVFEEVPHLPDMGTDDEDLDDDEDSDGIDASASANEGADPDMLPDAYRLRAFLPDCSYEIIAGDTSDWYAVPAMIGLMNVLCRARGSAMRFVELPSSSQNAIIIVAPLLGIRAARRAGLLDIACPGAAATLGRDFEDGFIASLRDHD